MQNLHKKVEGTSYDVEYSLKYVEQRSFFSLLAIYVSKSSLHIFCMCMCAGALSML